MGHKCLQNGLESGEFSHILQPNHNCSCPGSTKEVRTTTVEGGRRRTQLVLMKTPLCTLALLGVGWVG